MAKKKTSKKMLKEKVDELWELKEKTVAQIYATLGFCPLHKKDCFSYENGYCMNLVANMKQIAKLKHCKLYKSK